MLITAGSPIPKVIEDQLGTGEVARAVLPGLLGSGMAITQDRLFAWRPSGAVAPLPLRAIERILVDEGDATTHLQILIAPSSIALPPVALLRRGGTLAEVLTFITALVELMDGEPLCERWGPILRFTFAPEGMSRL